MPINIEIKGNHVTVTRFRKPRAEELTDSDKECGANAIADIVLITFGKGEPVVTACQDIVSL